MKPLDERDVREFRRPGNRSRKESRLLSPPRRARRQAERTALKQVTRKVIDEQ